MNKIDKDELFRHLSGFLKAKGVELQQGAYTQGIQKGCELLAETVNVSQEAWERGRMEMERQLEQMRQIIHERTAPKPPPTAAAASSAAGSAEQSKPRPEKTSKTKTTKRRRQK